MIDHLAYVKCDECGNPAEAVCGNAREARLAAKTVDRFKRIDNRDLCPQCVAALAGEDDGPDISFLDKECPRCGSTIKNCRCN